MVVAWVALGVLLLAVELRHLAFFALFGAAGAFAAALAALVWPELLVVQVLLAVVVATVGIVLVRPLMSNVLPRANEGHPARGVHGTLVGEEVLTLDEVGDAHHVGHVRLAGERWLAVSGSDEPIPADTRVVVTGVQGTTLVVWPVDGHSLLPPLPIEAPGDRLIDAPTDVAIDAPADRPIDPTES